MPEIIKNILVFLFVMSLFYIVVYNAVMFLVTIIEVILDVDFEEVTIKNKKSSRKGKS